VHKRMDEAEEAQNCMTESKDKNAATESAEQTGEDYVFEAAASFAQQRLWFLDQLEPGSSVYNINFALELSGALNESALQTALDILVARHESLRTTFEKPEQQPLQVIAESASILLDSIDVSNETDARVTAKLDALIHVPFDLATGPLLRVHLLKRAEDLHVILFVIHHIIADAWSLDILYRELVIAYTGALAGNEPEFTDLPIQYADYAEWQLEWLSGAELNKQLSYWREQLADAPELLELPLDRPRSRAQTHNGANIEKTLNSQTAAALKQLAQSSSCTLFILYLAAFNVLLGRYAATDDIVVGTPIAGRKRTELEGLIGFFVNTLGMRGDLSGDPSFRELLNRIKQVSLGAFAHQELPFEKLVEELQPERTMSHSPVFQVLFVLHHAIGNSLPFADLKSKSLRVDADTAKFDLSLYITELQDGLSILFEYNTDLFDTSTITRMLNHFETLLNGIVANPDIPASQLPLMDNTERQQVLSDFNNSAMPVDNLSVHGLVERQAALTPDAIALVMGEASLSYAELNSRANHLAHHLVKIGVNPGSLLGIACERSVEMAVGVLAILKSGAAYVPIDPNYPAERVTYMLEDSRVPVLLTLSSLRAQLPETSATTVCLDEFDWSAGKNHNLQVNSESVYAIYTSGSTGKPKGVELTHAGLSNLIQWQSTQPGLDCPARTLQFASLSFDVSFQELFTTWAQGGTVVLIDEELRRDLPALAKFIATDGIERVYLPYAALQPLADSVVSASMDYRVKDIIVAGEQLQVTPSIKQMFTALGDTRLHNQYGPSETHVVTAFTLSGNPEQWMPLPPIGRPVANTQVYVLDNNQEPVPVGVTGELYLAGVQIAKGYIHRPELTAEKFLPDPFKQGQRMYKTGDRVRFLADGNLEYRGRSDDQIKWRGFRIEPGEIETRLAEHPAVQQAAILLREDSPGDKRLVAYLVATPNQTLDTQLVRTWLKDQVPDYMLPSALLVLDTLPLTPSGKVARKKLPVPDYADTTQAYVAPRTPVEEVLIQLWSEVLGVTQVGIHDDFFELGGHSLLATQLISRVRDALEIELPLINLFNHPSIAEFVSDVDEARGETPLTPIPVCDRTSPPPLSFAQQRLWFLDQLDPGSPAYNFPIAIELTGALNHVALTTAINTLIARHESLRTTFSAGDDANTPVQIIKEELVINLQLHDFMGISIDQSQQELTRLTQLPFDLTNGPLLHAHLLTLAADKHILLLVTHHIVSDGWSLGILLTELATLYRAHQSERPIALPELAIQYADYATWQHNWLSGTELETQLDYWRDALANSSGILELPTDRPRPAEQTFNGASTVRHLPPELHSKLKQLASRQKCTLYMLLFAAFDVLLGRWAATDDVVVGTPIAGRKHTELENLVGFLSNTLAIPANLENDPTFSSLLQQIKSRMLGAYGHQELPFEKLVVELQPERAMSHSPIFQVMFVFQNTPASSVNFGEVTARPIGFEMGIAKFDLLMEMAESDDGLRAGLQFNTDLFDASTINRILNHFETLLTGIVTNPDSPISQLSLMDIIERQHVLTDFNQSAMTVNNVTVHSLVEQQAATTPDAIALVMHATSISYADLNSRANRLAHHLVSNGAGPGSLIGIACERSIAMAVSVLAVLKSGAAYVPIDPNYPTERIAYMLKEARTPVLITQSALLEQLPETSATLICLDKFNWSEGNSSNLQTSGESVYAIFTSGSTGKPKGVELTHAGLSNLLQWQATQPGLDTAARTLQFASLSFDVSFQELFTTWAQGGTVVLVDEELRRDLPALAKFIATDGIERVYLPYAALQPLAESVASSGLDYKVRDVIVAGEQLQITPSIKQMFAVLGDARLHNQYGPSETHVVTAFTLSGNSESWMPLPPIGTPIANTQVYVLDTNNEPVPVGVPGELYLAGVQVAKGYIHRPELTAEKFLTDPFKTGQRMYKTGDRVRFLVDGNLEYLGRTDDQIKWRGFRIEPGEIEARLTEHPAVQQAAVLLREDSPGDKRLVAYLVAAPDQLTDTQIVRTWLKDQVPDYMVPSALLVLDALPLTPSGKVARRKLPVPDYADATQIYAAPRTSLEEVLAQIWSEVLAVPRVGIHDDFFELGGHSLLATQLISRVRDALAIELPLKLIFRNSSVEQLAEAIENIRLTQELQAKEDSDGSDDFEDFSI
jgi:amino acid adenylation domain-containing protein